MTYSNITKILHPSELKLLCCGEPTCSVKQMKKLTRISVCDLENENLTEDDLIRMFWNVMENSLSANERIQFIRFSNGSSGLPAPGMRWPSDLEVSILSRKDKEIKGKKMLFAYTCTSTVDIPFYESEKELERMIRIAIENMGTLNDHKELFGGIASYLD